jgi:hypothetical protein
MPIAEIKDRRAQLLHEWEHGEHRYRLIARAKFTPGYEDVYVIEKLGTDSLGEPRWSVEHTWNPGEEDDDDDSIGTLLVTALKTLLGVRP